MTGMLSILGCDAHVAVNGRQALEMWSAEHYDLILMDGQMPELDGYAATRAIRQQEAAAVVDSERVDSDNLRIPIVALTARSGSGAREACVAAGMDDHLDKPFTRRQLSTVLAKWLPAMSTEQLNPLSDSAGPEGQRRVLDRAALNELRALDDEGPPEALQEVLTIYLRESSQLMIRLERAVDTVDVETMAALAHALKSMSENVGANALSTLCERLVQLGRAKTAGRVTHIFCDIKAAHAAARAALSQILRESADIAVSTR